MRPHLEIANVNAPDNINTLNNTFQHIEQQEKKQKLSIIEEKKKFTYIYAKKKFSYLYAIDYG